MDSVAVDGLEIAYERAGTGPPLVLLHGGFGDSRDWRRQLDDLSDEFTVVAWDAPGCGQSADPPDTFRASHYGDCLARFIAALALGRPHVLGLSAGSVIALELYGGHRGVPVSLILASAYAGWAGSLPSEEVDRRLAQVLRETELPPEQFVPGWIPTLLTPAAPNDLIDEVTEIMSDFHPLGTRILINAFGDADYRPVLPTITVPTLLLYGDADSRSPLHVAKDLHDQIAGSTLVMLPNVGHASNVEAPAAFNTAVRTFLHTIVA
ncbi:MAG: alpha/beta hydrolase [Euzebyales bacterium]|nr:alpha/beta hydrolase [Euzebyales bacterium]